MIKSATRLAALALYLAAQTLVVAHVHPVPQAASVQPAVAGEGAGHLEAGGDCSLCALAGTPSCGVVLAPPPAPLSLVCAVPEILSAAAVPAPVSGCGA